jgi:hypothetical protein
VVAALAGRGLRVVRPRPDWGLLVAGVLLVLAGIALFAILVWLR